MEVQKILVTVFFMLCSVSCVHWGQSLPTDVEYGKLKKAAGDHWDIEAYDDRIVITSRHLFWFYNAVSLPYMEEGELEKYIKESGRQDHYEITLRFVKRWTEEAIEEAREKNGSIYKAIGSLQEKHSLTHLTPNKMNSFFPETEEDEHKIKAYEKERDEYLSQLIDIPVYYSERYSIFISDNRLGFEGIWSEDVTMIDFSGLFTQH
jgi:hypothetical protein